MDGPWVKKIQRAANRAFFELPTTKDVMDGSSLIGGELPVTCMYDVHANGGVQWKSNKIKD